MAKKRTGVNQLTKEAIDVSIDFEALMDSIDFNSYLEKKEKKIIKSSIGYKLYDTKTKNASKLLKQVLKEINKNKRDISFELIYKLLETKNIRLEARKKNYREEEVELYTKTTHNLHKSFDKIPLESFGGQKGKHLIDDFNWAKILYFNELSICYSGLVKSSMSLGYSEQSITLLERLYPELKNIEINLKKVNKLKEKIERKEKPLTFSQILKLYTFALYNKGEAERLLHNEDSALRAFLRIIEIYEDRKLIKDISSDYYSALLRIALILIDMGRGAEAIEKLEVLKKALEKIEGENDYRAVDTRLEKASALIDKKEYEKAYKDLNYFIKNNIWNHTFAQRKAEVYKLRLLNEFKKNKPEDFQKEETVKLTIPEEMESCLGIFYNKRTEKLIITLELDKDQIHKIKGMNKKAEEEIIKLWKKLHPSREKNEEIVNIKKEYPKFSGSADKFLDALLRKSIERQDGGNFKKTCTYLAEYFKQEYEKTRVNKNIEKALIYFYLFLFNKYYFNTDNKNPEVLAKSFEQKVIPIIKENNVRKLIKVATQEKKIDFQSLLDSVEDEKYMKGFFNLYVSLMEENKDKSIGRERDVDEKIIEKLVERLIDIYTQKDKDIELERVKKRYDRFKEKTKFSKKRRGKKGKPEKFIEDFFFKNKDWMKAETIVDQMKRNTEDFIKKVVCKSKIHDVKKGEIKGILTVLRRWNSITPALRSSVNPSKGGGYFLHFSYNDDSFGIVIDPGYDFLENFFSQGFKIGDIDMVLVSHAHPDHTDNLPSITSLFHEMNSRLGAYYHERETNKKNLTLVLSPGVFEHYNRIIKSSEEVLKDIIVVHVKRNKEKTLPHIFKSKDDRIEIEIEAFGTSHQDLSQFQGLGFKIVVKKDKVPKAIIGYTGDAKWDQRKLIKRFNKCTIICAHLGSIVNILDKKDFCNTFCQFMKSDNNYKCKNEIECKKKGFAMVRIPNAKLIEQTLDENHLYLGGLALFFNPFLKKNCKLQLGIISEFGEELKHGIRMDLYNKFDAWFKDNNQTDNERARCLPGDIGLGIDVFTGNVYCHCCNRFIERNNINPIPYGKEDAICFICDECKSVKSSYQIGEKLKEFCDKGRELELADESRK